MNLGKLFFSILLITFISTSVFAQTTSQLLREALKHAKQNEHEKAMSIYHEILKKEPNQLLALQGLGLSFYILDEYQKSIPYLKKALKIDRRNITTLLGLARSYAKLKNYAKAHYYFKRVRQLNPYHIEARVGRARLYSENKQHHMAIKEYRKALELDPYYLGALLDLSDVYITLKEYDRAILIAKKYLEVKPKDVSTFIQVASIYETADKIKDAIHWYEKAKKVDPKNQMIFAKLSLLYGRIERVDHSLINLQKAVELQEGNIKNYITLGRAYGWLYRIDEAIPIFEKAYALAPKNKLILNELAALYLLDGRWDKTEDLYHKVLKLDPKNPQALSGLKKVKIQKNPVFTSRYNYKTFKNRRPDDPDTMEFTREWIQEMEFRINPFNKFTLLYQRNNRDQDDIQNNTTDYDFNHDIVSLKYDLHFRDSFFFSIRPEYNHFDDRNTNNFNFEGGTADRFSLFSYLLFSQKNFFSLFAYQRGLILRLFNEPDRSVQNPFDDYSMTFGFNPNKFMEVIAFYAYTDYKELKEQHDIEGSFTYRLPFFKQVELGYAYEWLSEPIERLNTFSFQFQDEYFKKILFSSVYKFITNNNDPDQGNTYKHTLKTQISFPLYQELRFNFEWRHEEEYGKDHDRTHEYRTFLTLPLGMF